MTPVEWLTQRFPAKRRGEVQYNLRAFCTTYGLDYLTFYRHVTRRTQSPQFDVLETFYRVSDGSIGLRDWIRFYEEDRSDDERDRGRA